MEEPKEVNQDGTATVEETKIHCNFKNFVQKFGALLGLILLSVVLAILSPSFLKIDNLMNIARQSSINALLSIGMLLPILTAGIDLSVGSILAVSIVMGGV